MADKILENAHKVTFLVHQYPEHTMGQIIELLQMPSIDINSAIWMAIEEGFITEPDKDNNGAVTLLNVPILWEFGQTVKELETALMFCFKKLATKQTDLEENYLSQWTAGYSSHDTLIALRQLILLEELAQYTIEDGENVYTFFTLYKNRAKAWGRSQFKKDPLAKEEK